MMRNQPTARHSLTHSHGSRRQDPNALVTSTEAWPSCSGRTSVTDGQAVWRLLPITEGELLSRNNVPPRKHAQQGNWAPPYSDQYNDEIAAVTAVTEEMRHIADARGINIAAQTGVAGRQPLSDHLQAQQQRLAHLHSTRAGLTGLMALQDTPRSRGKGVDDHWDPHVR